ncbi:MAG: LacI family DNA-binding transcriptional regulator [Brevinema sp.]
MKKITIKDVARLANVSTTTVSYVFNNPARVHKNTLKTVLEIAQKLGYEPNFNAVALRGRSMAVAVVVNFHYDQFLQNPTVSEAFPLISQYLTQQGFYCMPFFVTPEDLANQQLLTLINNDRIAGVLILASRSNFNILNAVLAKQLPLVVVGTIEQYSNQLYSIDNDNIRDTYQATMIAYEKGYQKIAYLSGDLDYLVCQQRLQGYTNAVIEKNAHPPFIYGFCEGREAIECAVDTMMKNTQPDAIVVKDDIKGVYTINKLQQLGYKVGDDVGVIGIGGITAGTFCMPQLSTMRFSIQDMFHKATESLIEQIRMKTLAVGQLVIDTEYLERESLPTKHL